MGIFNNKIFKNASWIIAGKIVQSILNLIVTMLSARYLGPSGYGLINYAASVVAFVAPIMNLGFNCVLVQEIVTQPEKEGETLGTAILTSFACSFLCITGVLAFVSIANAGEKTTLIVCALYSILLIFQALELIQYWFQAKLKSKYTSLVGLISYIVTSVYKIVLLVRGMNLYWFAVSHALDVLIISASLLIIYKKVGAERLRFSWSALKRMFARSKYYILSELMIVIFAQTDRIMLKLMIDDAATGYYSAAVSSAGLVGFVFAAIIESFRPVVLAAKKQDEETFEKNEIRLLSIVLYASLFVSLGITLFSPLIIRILYGAAYAPSVNALRVVVWYTTFSYLGSARNIWILAEGKQKYLVVSNLVGALSNVALNLVLIPPMGIVGAALASLITQMIANIGINFFIKPLRRSNLLIGKAFNPKYVLEMFKKEKPLPQAQEIQTQDEQQEE